MIRSAASDRLVADLPTARFTGRSWIIAMREAEWVTFSQQASEFARDRLIGLMRTFAENGEADMPGNAFRWLTRTHQQQPGTRLGAFEARGVVLTGRRALINGQATFFVEEVTVDPIEKKIKPQRVKHRDERQQRLPLGLGLGE